MNVNDDEMKLRNLRRFVVSFMPKASGTLKKNRFLVLWQSLLQ